MICRLCNRLLLALCVLVPLWTVFGEELRPYQLPSQRVAPYPSSSDRMALTSDPRADIQRFEDFRSRAEGLDVQGRAELEAGIRERLKQAIRMGRIEEARYYESLCAILTEIGP